jgi:hypothetical protein
VVSGEWRATVTVLSLPNITKFIQPPTGLHPDNPNNFVRAHLTLIFPLKRAFKGTPDYHTRSLRTQKANRRLCEKGGDPMGPYLSQSRALRPRSRIVR